MAARAQSHGGFSTWRAPLRLRGQSSYDLANGEDEVVLGLGTLATGISDEDLTEFWSRVLYRMRRYGLDAVARARRVP